jgi:hypothetical protein
MNYSEYDFPLDYAALLRELLAKDPNEDLSNWCYNVGQQLGKVLDQRMISDIDTIAWLQASWKLPAYQKPE